MSSNADRNDTHAVIIVEETLLMSLGQLCDACRASHEQVVALVHEGVLEPAGADPAQWQFAGRSLARARAALRLTRDLELDTGAVALVLDLLERIDSLEARLRRAGLG